jgi:hypothetical protein
VNGMGQPLSIKNRWVALPTKIIGILFMDPTVTEYEEHSKSGDLEAYTGSGQHKTSAAELSERKSDTSTRKAPPNQLTIPKGREHYQRGRRRRLSDSSYRSINENQGLLTPDPFGACHEDTKVTPYYQSRRVHPQQTPSREQYGR